MTLSTDSLRLFLARNGIFFALVLLIAMFAMMNSNFLSVGNGENVLRQAAELGIVALPLAFLVMAGTIDMSVGSVASLGAVVAGLAMAGSGSTALGVVAALGVGVVAGALNGFLVAYLRLNSFVITLGALSIWGGMALFLTGGKTVQRSQLPESFRGLGTQTVGPVPLQIALLVTAVAVAWYVLNRTQFGKQVLAVGGNARAARLMGVDVARVRFVLFVVSGLAAASAGLLLAAKVQSAAPTIGVGLELDALTVVLLGGVAFEGGIGRISGVVAGLLFFRVLRTGLVFMQASPFLQTVFVGLTLVVAVALDSSIQRVIRTSWSRLGKRATPRRTSGEDPSDPAMLTTVGSSPDATD